MKRLRKSFISLSVCVAVCALSFSWAAPGYAAIGAESISVPDEPGVRAAPPALNGEAGSAFFKWRSAERPHLLELAKVNTVHHQETAIDLRPVLSWETEEGKSYLIPAFEIPGFIIALNAFDRTFLNDKRTEEGKKTYATNPSTFWQQLSHQDWTFDQDTFRVNQFGHPYEGATMYGLARSSGLNFWQSLAYSNVGSFLWEMAGENSRPSFNDLITTGNAGSFLGEALFRMAELVLEEGGSKPPFGYEAAAAAISPSTGFNRMAFGKRFDAIFPNHQPATLWMCRAGASVDTHSTKLSKSVEERSHEGIGILEFSMSYGLPGKPGYTYHRPFDYFNFEVSTRATSHNLVDALTVYGLLKGKTYGLGNDYRGIWGLYGSYDYISPYLFRVSSTALSLGTTGQLWLGSNVAFQGTVLGGVGFGATGLETDVVEERGYHFGATPQLYLGLRGLFGERAMLDLTGRGYYVSSLGPDHDGSESVFRGHALFTVRIHGSHALGLQYSESIRQTNYVNISSKTRSEGTISLVYTFVSDRSFGAVEWHDSTQR